MEFRVILHSLLLLVVLVFAKPVPAVEISGGKPVSSAPAETSQSTANFSSFSGSRHLFYAGLSAFSRSILKTTSVSSAKKDFIAPLQYPLLLGYSYGLNANARLLFFTDYTLLPKKGPDGNIFETHLLLRFQFAKQLKKSGYEWKTGILLHHTRIEGKGGTATLNNGGSVADFEIPNSKASMNNLALEFGINYSLTPKLSWQSSLISEAPFHYQKRNFALLTGLAYQIGSN